MSAVFALPDGWSDTDSKSGLWRRGVVFRWATGFAPPQWLETRQAVSIRPQETGAEAYQRETGSTLPDNCFVFWRDA